MKKLQGYETAKIISGESTLLPKGGYIAKIMDCKEILTATAHYLSFSFDIAEGEHKDHYTKLWRLSTDENKRWKGNYNAFVPSSDNPYYENNLSRFKTMISDFEESNPGFHWDWKETELKGKRIGVIFAEKEFETDKGDIIIITEARGFRSVDAVKEGKYKIPPLKKLKSKKTNTVGETDGFNLNEFVELTDDGDLPFYGFHSCSASSCFFRAVISASFFLISSFFV